MVGSGLNDVSVLCEVAVDCTILGPGTWPHMVR